MSSRARGRVPLAVLVSSSFLPAAIGVYGMLTGWGVRESLVIALVYGVFNCAGTVVLGLPAHALLTRFGLRSMWHYVATGGLLGMLVLAGFKLVNPRAATELVTFFVFTAFGAITAAVFRAMTPVDA